MSEDDFLGLHHDEALSLLVFLRRREEDLDDSLRMILLKLERRLFAVHSIEEMESLVRDIQVRESGR